MFHPAAVLWRLREAEHADGCPQHNSAGICSSTSVAARYERRSAFMSKKKSTTAACLGMLTLASLVTTSPATAQWMVGGATLGGTETKALAKTAAVDENMTFKFAGVTLTCQGERVNAVTPQIEASGEMSSASSLEFTQCSASENCQIPTTIATIPVLVHAALDPGDTKAVLATILPKTKTTFTTIKFEGEKCALLGTQPVTGKAKVLIPAGQEELAKQLVEAKVTAGSSELKVGSSAAEIKGSALVRLVSGATWSFL
jgi:hypothetical protein